MPKRLLARCRPDSIREFRASAKQRYQDGLAALAGGRGLAAIYLWGYSAEMLLKAAYFASSGVSEKAPLTMKNLLNAITTGQALGIVWPKSGQAHNVRAWAELLALEWETNPHPRVPFTHKDGKRLQVCGQSIALSWDVTLRYHKNKPYRHEVNQVCDAVDWLFANILLL